MWQCVVSQAEDVETLAMAFEWGSLMQHGLSPQIIETSLNVRALSTRKLYAFKCHLLAGITTYCRSFKSVFLRMKPQLLLRCCHFGKNGRAKVNLTTFLKCM